MEEENTVELSFDELNDDLQEQVIQHFQEDDFLVPDQWWEWTFEYIAERHPLVEWDPDRTYFDNRYGISFEELSGSIDTQHSDAPQLSEKFWKFYDKEWIYDVTFNFEKDAFTRADDGIAEDVIFDDIEEDIFGKDDLEWEDEKLVLDINTTKPLFTKALVEYGEYPEIKEQLENWITEMESLQDLFFQETLTIEEDDYDNLLETLRSELVSECESLLDEAHDTMQPLLDDFYNDLKTSLQEDHDHYYTDEYARESLSGRRFIVTLDEDGEQLEIDDLNGEW